MGVN
jgi:DNA-directed RNA polymerase II subunit RPB2